MVVPDLWPHWQAFLDGIEAQRRAYLDARPGPATELEVDLAALDRLENFTLDQHPSASPVCRMKINCLMGTFGRYEFVCESLSSFLQQTALADANLLIFNQHPVPLYFDHPRVRVINEQMKNVGLRDIKRRMLELSDPKVEFLHWWDDDDLYLPWHLEDCLARIGDNLAWKPARSWWTPTRGVFHLGRNYFEPSWIIRAGYVRGAPFDTHPLYCDHPANKQLWDAGLVATTEMGALSSYIYRWGNGRRHISQHRLDTSADQIESVEQARSDAVLPPTHGRLVTVDLWPQWQLFLEGIKDQVTPEELDEIQARLSIADATSRLETSVSLGAGGGT